MPTATTARAMSCTCSCLQIVCRARDRELAAIEHGVQPVASALIARKAQPPQMPEPDPRDRPLLSASWRSQAADEA